MKTIARRSTKSKLRKTYALGWTTSDLRSTYQRKSIKRKFHDSNYHKNFLKTDKSSGLIYKSLGLIPPHLEFSNLTWYPRLKKQRRILEDVQIRATYLFEGLQSLSYYKRLESLDSSTCVQKIKDDDMLRVEWQKRNCWSGSF